MKHILDRPVYERQYDPDWDDDTPASALLGAAGRNEWQPRWWLLAVSALAVGLILGLGALVTLDALARPILLFILGLTTAATLAPAVHWLSKHMPRVLAVVLVYLALTAFLVGIGVLISPPLLQQAQQVSDSAPALFDRLQDFSGSLPGSVGLENSNGTLLGMLTSALGNFGSSLLSLPLQISTYIFEIILVVFVSIYLLIEAPGIRRFLSSLLPPENADGFNTVLDDMLDAMGGYLRGSALNGLIVGILTYIGLLVIGVDYPLVLAVLAGLLELIPTIGPILSAIPIVLVALSNSPTTALIALAFVVVLQQVENNLLVPNIMKRATDVSPLVTILALFAGATLGGLLGALAAIPIVAALRVLLREVVAPRIRFWTGARRYEPTDSQD